MNNSKVYIFVTIMTVVVGVTLTGLYTATKPQADLNEELFNKRAILSSLGDKFDGDLAAISDEELASIFKNQVEQFAINPEGEMVEGVLAENVKMKQEMKLPAEDRKLPVYVYTAQDKSKYYIVSVRGRGLWDAIWGNIAIANDFNTVVGVSFDHAGETPGLGAEIKDNKAWVSTFAGKTIYDDQGEYVSVSLKKGGAPPGSKHYVDGLTGATITGNGVSDMLYDGIRSYEPYFKQVKSNN